MINYTLTNRKNQALCWKFFEKKGRGKKRPDVYSGQISHQERC